MRKMSLTLVALLLVSSVSISARASEIVYNKLLQSVGLVSVQNGQGSGVIVDADLKLLVTNYHVVKEAKEVKVLFPKFADGQLISEKSHYAANLDELAVKGRVLTTDQRRDLALIELDRIPDGMHPITMVATSARPGERVHAVGNPSASDAAWVYNSGTVRAVYNKSYVLDKVQAIEARVVETQSPINPGDSGGPVVNDECELIGVVSAFKKNDNLVSVAIDVSELKDMLKGDNKTVDSRVREALETAGYDFTVDKNGLFSVTFPNADGSSQIIFIESRTRRVLNVALRHIWSPAVASNKAISDAVASLLLKENGNLKIGAWETRQLEKEFFAIFTAKINANTEKDSLKTLIRLVGTNSFKLRKEVEKIEPQRRSGIRTISASPQTKNSKGLASVPAPQTVALLQPPAQPQDNLPQQPQQEPAPNEPPAPEAQPQVDRSIVGCWVATMADQQYGNLMVGMRLDDDGTIHIAAANAHCTVLNVRGRYQFDGETMTWTTCNEQKQGTITFTATGFVLENETLKLEFTPLANNARVSQCGPSHCGNGRHYVGHIQQRGCRH